MNRQSTLSIEPMANDNAGLRSEGLPDHPAGAYAADGGRVGPVDDERQTGARCGAIMEFRATEASPTEGWRSGPLPGGHEVDEEHLVVVFERINAIWIRKGLETAIEIGRLLLDEFFPLGLRSFEEHHKRHLSYRALAKRPGLGPSATWLNAAIRIVGQMTELPPEIAWSLSLTHHRALLPIHDLETKTNLAKRAVEDKLSTRVLSEESQKIVDAQPKRGVGGRPRLPKQVKRLNRGRDAVRALAGEAFDRRVVLNHFSRRELTSMAELLEAQASELRSIVDITG